MKIVEATISLDELKKMSEKMFNSIVKAVVDVEQELMVVDASMHSDEEEYLLEQNESLQENLWGINLRPEFFGTDKFIEFDSMINIRPGDGNSSRGVENPAIQKKIREIVAKKVVR